MQRDCLRWNARHGQGSLEFRRVARYVGRRRRRIAKGLARKRRARARFSPSRLGGNNTGSPTAPGNVRSVGSYHPSRVSCVAHYQPRTKGDPTSVFNESRFPGGTSKNTRAPRHLDLAVVVWPVGRSTTTITAIIATTSENFCLPRPECRSSLTATLGILGTYLCPWPSGLRV